MFLQSRKAIFAACLSLTAFALPASAGEFSAAQKSEIKSIIHSYLVEHPEVLREASVELEKKQQQEENALRRTVIVAEQGRPVHVGVPGRGRQSQGQDHADRVFRLQLRLLQKGAWRPHQSDEGPVRTCAWC